MEGNSPPVRRSGLGLCGNSLFVAGSSAGSACTPSNRLQQAQGCNPSVIDPKPGAQTARVPGQGAQKAQGGARPWLHISILALGDAQTAREGAHPWLHICILALSNGLAMATSPLVQHRDAGRGCCSKHRKEQPTPLILGQFESRWWPALRQHHPDARSAPCPTDLHGDAEMEPGFGVSCSQKSLGN